MWAVCLASDGAVRAVSGASRDDCLLRQDGALLCLLCVANGAPPVDTPVTQAEDTGAPELFKHDHLCICDGCNAQPLDGS